ncbi:MAG TPA: PQQ-dependent sugar dehydrogenase [Vicinamibacterales bacterium]|jgi:glucose/arabinose dehydrogenase
MSPIRLWAAVVVCLAGSWPISVIAQGQLRPVVVARGFTLPLGFLPDPTDPRIQFVVEQGGRLRVLRDGVLLASDFLDLSAAIAAGGEQGLLGLAFAPDYATSGRFFVDFTNRSGDTVVARFRRSTANPLVADPSSRFDLKWSTGERVIRQPFANHNGGQLAFGPDGFLYVGMGDGGSGDDPGNRAQDPSTLLGKMLRVDVSVPDGDTQGFRVPADNPFGGGRPIAAQPEIWDFGLRNPWRFSFDAPSRGGTGALVIGDVGQDRYEEIDYEPRGQGGRNYGWRIREGLHANVTTRPPAFTPLTDPIFEYDHSAGVAVIGGFVYRGQALGPAYAGRYFYADLTGHVWSLGLGVNPATGEATVTDQSDHTADLGIAAARDAITSFGLDAAGELYIVTFLGTIIRVEAADSDGDGLPDWWERQFGLNPDSAVGDDGAAGDPDGDGVTNIEEFRAGTHPRGFYHRSFGNDRIDTSAGFTLLNPNGTPAHILLRYRRPDGSVFPRYLSLPPGGRQRVNPSDTPGRTAADILLTLESDVEVVVEGARLDPRSGLRDRSVRSPDRLPDR